MRRVRTDSDITRDIKIQSHTAMYLWNNLVCSRRPSTARLAEKEADLLSNALAIPKMNLTTTSKIHAVRKMAAQAFVQGRPVDANNLIACRSGARTKKQSVTTGIPCTSCRSDFSLINAVSLRYHCKEPQRPRPSHSPLTSHKVATIISAVVGTRKCGVIG